jgi:hypothetical protein
VARHVRGAAGVVPQTMSEYLAIMHIVLRFNSTCRSYRIMGSIRANEGECR